MLSSGGRAGRWVASGVACLAVAALANGPAEAGKSFDHGTFDSILRRFVKAGRVDYSGIKRSALPDLDAYLGRVAGAEPRGMSRRDKLAFYLNAYNAHVIRAVAKRLPLRSVMAVKGFFDRIEHRVAGRRLTLNDLESKVIRRQFDEPRIHFALVCAARSCPPLQSRAFTAGRLQRMLEGATRRFLNSKEGVQIAGGKARVSKLFEWYAVDFNKAAGSVGEYVARYRRADRAALTSSAPAFLHYNWTLNGK